MSGQFGKALERCHDRWDPKELAELVRQLREFGDSLAGKKAKKEYAQILCIEKTLSGKAAPPAFIINKLVAFVGALAGNSPRGELPHEENYSVPHNLATKDGKTSMMYYGETPWHRLGQRLDNPATAEEAIVAAGLDYEVQLTPLATVDGLEVPQRKAVVRYDTQQVLGVVGNNFVPVQNRQAFGFLDAVVGEGSLRYHTAGALGKGEKIWLLAKLPDQIRVKNSDDIVDKFLLLANAHDGSAALRVLFTPVRVVCQNTLSMALRQGEHQGVSIRHEGDLAAKLKQAQEVLGFAHRFYDDAQTKIDMLASHYPTPEQLRQYFQSLYSDPEEDKSNARAKNIREELHRLFETGIGHDDPAIKGTSWTAFNSVTEYVDHRCSGRGQDDPKRASRRLDSIWFGSGARLKQQAWDLALQMATSS